MIQYIHVVEAVNVVNGWQPIANVQSNVVKQLAGSLQVYKGRGEFDGTMDSAYECLKQAEYELEKVK